MEAPQKWCLPERFTPLEIPVLALRNRAGLWLRWIILQRCLAAEQWGTCVFRRKSATHSDPNRPGIPIQTGHPWARDKRRWI